MRMPSGSVEVKAMGQSYGKSSKPEQLAVDSLAAVLRHANHMRTRRNIAEEADINWSGIVVQASQSLVDATKSFPSATEAANIDKAKLQEIASNLLSIADSAYKRSKAIGGIPVKTAKSKIVITKQKWADLAVRGYLAYHAVTKTVRQEK